MVSIRSLLAAITVCAVAAALPGSRPNANLPRPPSVPLISGPEEPVTHVRTGTALPPLNTTYHFDQLVDHTNPALGTFKQRYWHTWEWYNSGGPIILFTPGEGSAEGFTGYLVNKSLNGQIAQQEGGATIVLEHRYYGLSTPTANLSAPNLKYHTIQQAIDDLEYFSKNVKLPMPGGDSVGPDVAPWILMGGSYSGALTSWTMVNKPGLFWAGYASSAVVQAITDFWQYFEPIRTHMPQNCSADVEAVISHIDTVFTSGPQSEIDQIKASFGLSNLTHLDDVAAALRNNMWDWQDMQPDTGPNATFFRFCDALEVKNGVSAPASGWGVEHALPAWGRVWTEGYLDNLCLGSDVQTCLGTHDPNNTLFTDVSIGNDYRSWSWIVCNEVGWNQEAAPQGHPTIVTRFAQPSYDERVCPYFFPEAFPEGSIPTPNVAKTNAAYQGWNVHVDRLFFANGIRDPWRDATVSADGLSIQSTPEQPIAVDDGFHTSNLITKNAAVDPTVKAVQAQALEAMHRWLKAFKPSKRETKRKVMRVEYERGITE